MQSIHGISTGILLTTDAQLSIAERARMSVGCASLKRHVILPLVFWSKQTPFKFLLMVLIEPNIGCKPNMSPCLRRARDNQYSSAQQPDIAATSEDGGSNNAFSALGRALEDLALFLRRTKCIALMDLVVPKEEVRFEEARKKKEMVW